MHSYCIYCDGDGDSEDGDGGDDGVLFWGSHYGNAVTTMGVQVVCLMSNKEKKRAGSAMATTQSRVQGLEAGNGHCAPGSVCQ